ncbi:MAG: coniferyl aldehyde dehydrogenase [Myxococcales bacterium]|nr:coniferyl aldehyde dehydrogenase [Myxococcales bacterium]
MSLPSVEAPPGAHVQIAFDAQRAAFREAPFPDYAQRKRDLRRMLDLLIARQDDICATIGSDYGHRSAHESLMSDVYLTTTGIRHLLQHLHGWMAPTPAPVGLALQPGRAEIVAQPLGVVGVISPWNYPLNLALLPAACALAAGNRVMIKPSEHTPRTSELLRELMAEIYAEDQVAVCPGDVSVATAFASLPFDHLFYTGSTRVGRLVMQAAAGNLTPVTLELGGKSPVWVHPDYPVQRAAASIVAGKLFNAGQTCVAPDYVIVTEERRDPMVSALKTAIEQRFPKLQDNPDYTSVAHPQHHQRLQHVLQDARDKGATLVEVNPSSERFDEGRKMAPVIVQDATDEMLVLQEEIFGPILPVITVPSSKEVASYVNERPRPLAFYIFDRDTSRVDELLKRTHSGGVTVNDTLLHVAEANLPFGGVGASGMGAYHGKAGFDTFSHHKAVFRQPRFNARFLLDPPYGRTVERLLSWLM